MDRRKRRGVERLSIPPGPLCAGEALLEARTQASVALFKLGAHSHSATLQGGSPCLFVRGIRPQVIVRAERFFRERFLAISL